MKQKIDKHHEKKIIKQLITLKVMNESFVKEVEKKLQEKMEVSNEIKNTQIRMLQEKLREHVSNV